MKVFYPSVLSGPMYSFFEVELVQCVPTYNHFFAYLKQASQFVLFLFAFFRSKYLGKASNRSLFLSTGFPFELTYQEDGGHIGSEYWKSDMKTHKI